MKRKFMALVLIVALMAPMTARASAIDIVSVIGYHYLVEDLVGYQGSCLIDLFYWFRKAH